jgi:hypothetical protein
MRNKFVLKGDVVKNGQVSRVFWTGYDWSPNLHNAAKYATEHAAIQSRQGFFESKVGRNVMSALAYQGSIAQNVRTCEL